MKSAFLWSLLLCKLILNMNSSYIPPFNLEGFRAVNFLKSNTWFDLKNYFYSINNLAYPDEQELYLARNSLETLKSYRMEKIIYILLRLINPDLPEKELAEKLDEHKESVAENTELDKIGICAYYLEPFANLSEIIQRNSVKEILLLFPGNKCYFVSPTHLYIFNYFGSETPTSDLDYGLYRLDLDDPHPPFFKELQNISDINHLIMKAEERFLSLIGRRDLLLQELLDVNGYPDMYVVYHRFFQSNRLDTIMEHDSGLLANFSNYFGSLVMRLCNNSLIHIFNREYFSSKRAYDFRHQDMVINCFRRIVLIQKNLKRKTRDPSYKIIPFSKAISFKNERDFLKLGIYYKMAPRYAPYHKRTTPFKKCLDMIKTPEYFLKFFLDLDESPKHKTTDSVVYDKYLKIFYVGHSENDKEQSLSEHGPNMIYMPFISACFSMTSEAYSTIGPLEYVKFQRRVEAIDENPEKMHLGCFSLIETFADNFAMLLSHLVEEDHISSLALPASISQSNSDAYSKYLIRALGVFRLSCISAVSEVIPSFITKPITEVLEIVDNRVYQFYLEADKVRFNIEKKKDWYEIFERSWQHDTLEDLVKETFDFFQLLFDFVIDNLDEKALFYKAKVSESQRELI